MKVATCERCKLLFKAELVTEVLHVDSKGEHRTQMCGVCALLRVNEIHRLPDDQPFRGPKAMRLFIRTAIDLQQRMLDWRHLEGCDSTEPNAAYEGES